MNPTDLNGLPTEIKVRTVLKPGDIGYLTYLHGTLYAREYGWDHTFEAYVAGPLAEFATSPDKRQRIWIVENGGVVAGSIAIVEASNDMAQLRWFLLHPGLRGLGIGRTLLEEALAFSRVNGYGSVFLWTVSALKAAAALYRSVGFQLKEENRVEEWGTTVNMQRFELKL